MHPLISLLSPDEEVEYMTKEIKHRGIIPAGKHIMRQILLVCSNNPREKERLLGIGDTRGHFAMAFTSAAVRAGIKEEDIAGALQSVVEKTEHESLPAAADNGGEEKDTINNTGNIG